jgi:hypothetical protein
LLAPSYTSLFSRNEKREGNQNPLLATTPLKRVSSVLNAEDAETTFETTDKSPFPFVLKAKLKSNGTTTTAHQDCDATINPFMEMMVKGPFQQLFDYMSERLAKEFV